MSKVNQWEGLAFSYAVMGLAMKLGDDHPISGPLAKALNNKRGPMIESEQIENFQSRLLSK